MWFKNCPRCGGDLYLRDNIDSQEVVCIQCSHIMHQENKLMASLKKQMFNKSKAKKKVA